MLRFYSNINLFFFLNYFLIIFYDRGDTLQRVPMATNLCISYQIHSLKMKCLFWFCILLTDRLRRRESTPCSRLRTGTAGLRGGGGGSWLRRLSVPVRRVSAAARVSSARSPLFAALLYASTTRAARQT